MTPAFLALQATMPAWATVSQDGGELFSAAVVVDEAMRLAQAPFTPPRKAPEALGKLDFDEYRNIRYRKQAAIWGAGRTRFAIELYPPGYLFRDLVEIAVVERGMAYPVVLKPESFETPDSTLLPLLRKAGQFTGFRLHFPLNSADYKDEFLVFQGASYFRAVSARQIYGLSARGLALNVAEPNGEEHPIFRRFWIERPAEGADKIIVHALLDSPSVTGAYRFVVFPGNLTRIEVEASLFPRVELTHVGIAPLTSMFLQGPLSRQLVDDYRPAVHDSQALAMWTGKGERIWRPLSNPRTLQISAFLDNGPKGFGLIQRSRNFAYYNDLGGHYQMRPSAWVAPRGDWGKGHVNLYEIPSDSETNDNIVAYWRPAEPLAAGRQFDFAYVLTWPDDAPFARDMAAVAGSFSSRERRSGNRQVVVDYELPPDVKPKSIDPDFAISSGRIVDTSLQAASEIGGLRIFVTFDPEGAEQVELRLQLRRENAAIGETWLYRWTNG